MLTLTLTRNVGWLLVSGAALAGCLGNIGSGGDDVGATTQACRAPDVTPLRRLTRWEYNNSVHDLLGDETRPADKFVPEAEQFGFDNNADGATLNALVIEQYEDAARTLANSAIVDLPRLLGCDPATVGEDECARQFIASFGKRAYRRPLSEEETTRFFDFYASHKAGYGFDGAIGMVVQAALQSPNFLYRIELGMPAPGADAVPLAPYEVASRLSYLFWGSMPDDELFGAAERGELATAEQIRAQAERLLAHDNGARAIKNFYGQWARLASLALIDRSDGPYTPEIGALMRQETETFADEVLRRGDGLLSTFLTAPYSYMNTTLAQYYGIEGPAGADFEQVSLDDHYSGVMTQGALMAVLAHPAQPSPVLRGKFIREQLLCAPPPDPPNDVDTTLPAIDPQATARQQLEKKTSVEPCLTCHSYINPPGFAFEHFDENGRYRDTEHGLTIDASGELTDTDVDGHYQDNTDLMALLADSEKVRSCLVVQWFRYAYGRDKNDADGCTLDTLETAFTASQGNVRELLIALTQTPAFLYRAKLSGGAP